MATASWAGFTLSRTILDPGRSERLAEQLLENPQVREALVDRLADAVEPQRAEGVLNGFALWVENAVLQGDVNTCFHYFLLFF